MKLAHWSGMVLVALLVMVMAEPGGHRLRHRQSIEAHTIHQPRGRRVGQGPEDVQCVQEQCQPSSGGACNDSITCENGFCNDNNVCEALRTTGQPCDSKSQCIGGDVENTVCTNGTCQTVTRIAEHGQACNFQTRCVASLYCYSSLANDDNGECVSYHTLGEACIDGIPCAAGYSCNLGMCINSFSVQMGGVCSIEGPVYYSFSRICSPSLYCRSNSTTGGIGVCTKGFKSSNAPCNGTCANAEEVCGCVGVHTQCIAPVFTDKDVADDWSQLQSCVAKENCNIQDPTCCHSHQCAWFEEVYGGNADYFTCSENPYSFCDKRGMTDTEETALIVAAVAVGLILVSLVAYFVRRSHRHSYSPIA